MTRNEQRNRANKATAIADTLQAVHCDSDTATALTPEGWRLATVATAERIGTAWTASSPATQAAVVAILVDRERTVVVTQSEVVGAWRAARTSPDGRPATAPTTAVLAAVVAAHIEAHAEVHAGYEPPHAPGSLRVDPQPAAGEPACAHPDVAYCDVCDPDPETRQRDEAAGCWTNTTPLNPYTPDDPTKPEVAYFGDSLSWDAGPTVTTTFPTERPDDRMSWNVFGGTQVTDWMSRMHEVDPTATVVAGLGTNDIGLQTLQQAQWNTLAGLNELADVSCVVWLTLDENSAAHRGPAILAKVQAYNAMLRTIAAPGYYPNLRLQDWAATSAGHDDWLNLPTDPVHHSPAGNEAYAAQLVDAPNRCTP